MNMEYNKVEGCFLGLAIGDALGVPVEFQSRRQLTEKPVTKMLGFMSWNQPPGTWSDDSSLAFCLAESLTKGYDLEDIGRKSLAWMIDGYWGAHDEVFDVGNTTKIALQRLKSGRNSFLYSGERDEASNGNGSLMKIAPAALYFHNVHDDQLWNAIHDISAITHAHFRSCFCCFVYCKYLIGLYKGEEKLEALRKASESIRQFIDSKNFSTTETQLLDRIFTLKIADAKEDEIKSSGYVLHTLEASIWCLLTTSSYKEAVLKAVNLGGDTDTTACVTGALAGVYYGMDEIPQHWMEQVARREDIIDLAKRFAQSI